MTPHRHCCHPKLRSVTSAAAPGPASGSRLHSLHEDYGFRNRIALLDLIEPGANLDDPSVGRFWPAKLVTELRERKLKSAGA
ncbi:MAG: hypothetical protein NTW21_25705 [Verrucomicrobia bacterium]|nr:hypothetical protein [Verrucomicrobiota bacterium]